MKKNILQLAIGLILAVAAVLMLRNYLEEQKTMVLKQAQQAAVNIQSNQVAIFVARKPIPAGAPITASMVDMTVADRGSVSPEAVRYFSELEGKGAARAISPGEQITTDALRIMEIPGGDNDLTKRFSMIIPDGKRAVGMNVDNISSIMDMIKPGDHVDVIAIIELPTGQGPGQLINVPIFQDVTVLAVGSSFGQNKLEQMGSSIQGLINKEKAKKPTEVAPPITVALDPEEANVISFVQEKGKIRLILRAPGDTRVINYAERQQSPNQAEIPAIMDYNSFLSFLMSRGLIPAPRQPTPQEAAAMAAQQHKQAPPEEKPKVEIFRGQNKEVKELIQ